MHEVVFYRDKNGKEPVNEYLKDLAQRKGKDSRIKLNKIQDYIEALSVYGKTAGEPYMKHIEGEIHFCTASSVYEKNAENSPAGNRTG